jgi:hypothetical protein
VQSEKDPEKVKKRFQQKVSLDMSCLILSIYAHGTVIIALQR